MVGCPFSSKGVVVLRCCGGEEYLAFIKQAFGAGFPERRILVNGCPRIW